VKASDGKVGPGPNFFGVDNAFVDEQGRLHLKITQQGSDWVCAEIIGEDTLGYGTYSFRFASPVARLDPNVVLGAFTWSNDPAQAHREIDIECGFNGLPENRETDCQFLVQPYSTPGNLKRFRVPAGLAPTTHQFRWQRGRVEFLSTGGGGTLEQWSLSQGVPDTRDETVRLNLWLNEGRAPADGRPVEIIVSDFTFTPLDAPGPKPRITRLSHAAIGNVVAPGSLVSLYGSGFAAVAASASTLPLPTRLAETQVAVQGRRLPLLYISPTQINAQLPWEALPGTATAVVTVGEQASDGLSFVVERAAPGTFQWAGSRCVAQNEDGGLNRSEAPAAPGSVLTIYMTGQGAVDSPVATGAPSSGNPLLRPLLRASAAIGGQEVELLYYGMTPGLVGVAQANVRAPALPLNDHEFILTQGSVTSNPCLLRLGDSNRLPAPLIAAVSPASGPAAGGTIVAIAGEYFRPGATVRFGGATAVGVTVSSANRIQATTPRSAAGAVDVVVTNADGQSGTRRGGFQYLAAPTVSSVSPSSGPPAGGTRVTITGGDFREGATVRFGSGMATGVALTGSSTLQATTPPGAPGPVDVTITNPDTQSGTLPRGFTYVPDVTPAPPPRIVAQVQGCRVSGRVENVSNPAATQIVVYARTTLYYIQPCFDERTHPVRENLTWGPIDLHAGSVYLMLVRSGYVPATVLETLPAVDGTNVLVVTGSLGTTTTCDVQRCPAQ
jgi:uncharacterized protein (TIGR03437 family)